MWTKLPRSRGYLMVYPIGWSDTLLWAVIILNSGIQQCPFIYTQTIGRVTTCFLQNVVALISLNPSEPWSCHQRISRSLYAILSNLQPCENTETHAEGHRMVWSWPALIATWLFQSAATAHLTGRVGVPKNVLGKIPRIHCVKRKMQTIPSLASPTHRLYDSPKTKFPEVLCS